MQTFKDLPETYKARIHHMYKKQAPKVLACKNIMRINHLIALCPACEGQARPHKYQTPSLINLDRLYVVVDQPWPKYCIRQLVNKRIRILTNLEFPTPIIKYRSVTRVPLFYDCVGNVVIDVFSPDQKTKHSGYYFKHSVSVCKDLGMAYEQFVYDREAKTFEAMCEYDWRARSLANKKGRYPIKEAALFHGLLFLFCYSGRGCKFWLFSNAFTQCFRAFGQSTLSWLQQHSFCFQCAACIAQSALPWMRNNATLRPCYVGNACTSSSCLGWSYSFFECSYTQAKPHAAEEYDCHQQRDLNLVLACC